MSTLKQVRTAARELDRVDDLVDSLQQRKQRLSDELDTVNAELASVRADRDTKKAAFITLVSELT